MRREYTRGTTQIALKGPLKGINAAARGGSTCRDAFFPQTRELQ